MIWLMFYMLYVIIWLMFYMLYVIIWLIFYMLYVIIRLICFLYGIFYWLSDSCHCNDKSRWLSEKYLILGSTNPPPLSGVSPLNNQMIKNEEMSVTFTTLWGQVDMNMGVIRLRQGGCKKMKKYDRAYCDHLLSHHCSVVEIWILEYN